MNDGKSLWPDGIEVRLVDDVENSQNNLDLETTLGEAVGRGELPPLIRIWRSALQTGIGVSRRDVSGDDGEYAMKVLRDEGCDVVVRNTGGTAVPQGPGVVHLSYLFPRQHRSVTTDAYYRILCDPLIDWLKAYGLDAYTGALPGSYCDGNYNILVEGKKLVGTAQAWRGGLAGMKSARPGYVIAHACMVVDVNLGAAVERINRFYALSKNEYRVHGETTTSLRALVPERFTGLDAMEASTKVAKEWVSFFGRVVASHGTAMKDHSGGNIC